MDFEEMLVQEAAREASDTKEVATHAMTPAPRKFDTRAVMADLKVMETKCASLVNEANALEIKTKEQNMEAVNISGKLQELTKQVKKKCEDFLAPHKKVTSTINGPKNRIVEVAKRAKDIVNQKIVQYGKQEKIDQAKQQKVIDKATEELQESLNKQADELGIEAPKVAAIKAAKPVKIQRGDSGASVYTMGRWKCEIVDPDKVPFCLKDKDGKETFRLCLPSTKLLNQAVKMGVRNIDGCRIYKDEKPVTRTG